MKHILITTIAAVLVVGCGPSEADIALRNAAMNGDIEAVKQHLDAGADVNTKDEDGETPLHTATYRGDKEIAELLIAAGADVNATSTPEYTENKFPQPSITPLDHAKGEIADLLRKHGAKTSAWLLAAESIHYAAATGNIEAVKQHLAAGADVNVKDIRFGGTPLHLAFLLGEEESASMAQARCRSYPR